MTPPLLGRWVGWVEGERLGVEAVGALKSNQIMCFLMRILSIALEKKLKVLDYA